MPGPGQAQPNLPGNLVFSMADVIANEAGLPPSTVITAGNSVALTTTFGFTGLLTGLVVGDQFDVVHHVENLETGNRSNLFGGSFTVTAANAANIPYTSPAYTTGVAGSGSDLEIPAGFDGGTFRILTHVHAADPNVRPIIAAFHDGLVVEVI